jgi:hypothetical protein
MLEAIENVAVSGMYFYFGLHCTFTIILSQKLRGKLWSPGFSAVYFDITFILGVYRL